MHDIDTLKRFELLKNSRVAFRSAQLKIESIGPIPWQGWLYFSQSFWSSDGYSLFKKI